MNQWKSAGIVVIGAALLFGGTKVMASLDYTQKDFSGFTEIDGEAEVLAQVGKYCYPVIKKDRDTQTCALWLDKWYTLRKDGPDKPKEVAMVEEPSENPMKGGGSLKGK